MSNSIREAMCRNYNLEIYADHLQFILEDEDSSSTSANDTKLHMLTVSNNSIYIGTWRDGTVQIELEVCKAKPESADSLENWDHVEETTLQVSSGRIRIRETLAKTPQDFVLPLPEKTYRVRVY